MSHVHHGPENTRVGRTEVRVDAAMVVVATTAGCHPTDGAGDVMKFTFPRKFRTTQTTRLSLPPLLTVQVC
jgi:hypothetical protein